MVRGNYRLVRTLRVRHPDYDERIIVTQRTKEPTLALAISRMNEWVADPDTLSANIETFA